MAIILIKPIEIKMNNHSIRITGFDLSNERGILDGEITDKNGTIHNASWDAQGLQHNGLFNIDCKEDEVADLLKMISKHFKV